MQKEKIEICWVKSYKKQNKHSRVRIILNGMVRVSVSKSNPGSTLESLELGIGSLNFKNTTGDPNEQLG